VRQAAKVDANQPGIIEALHRIGVQTCYIKQPVDLLIAGGALGSRNVLLEVKMPGERLNLTQQDFWDKWPGEKAIVHSVDEALEVVLGKGALA
jgi:hypothetical protein